MTLILFLWTSVSMLRFPYGLDYGEAPLMNQANLLLQQQEIYKSSIDIPPYTISNYPPLYILTVAGIHLLFKIPLFQTGRLISVIFSLLSGLLIFSYASSLTRNKLLGFLAVALFLGNPYTMLWSALARVDMMALALSLLGLWILFRKDTQVIWILVACLCFLASVFTRQTYLLAGPLAAFVWLWTKNRKLSMLFIFLFGAFGLLIFGMINAMTHGGFYSNIVVANINFYDFSRTLALFRQLFVIWPIILIACIGIIFTLTWAYFHKKANFPEIGDKSSFLIFGLGVFTIGAFISALTIGKVGSDVNYFLELISACSIWVAIGLKMLSDRSTKARTIAIGLLSLQLVWVFLASFMFFRATISSRWDELVESNKLFHQVQAATQKGYVLSDDYLDMVVLSGQSIYYQPFEYGQLYHAGLWNPSSFAAEIEQQKFPMILISGTTLDKSCCWPPELIAAISNKYEISYQSNLVRCTPK